MIPPFGERDPTSVAGRSACVVAAAWILALGGAAPASAEWHRAESERFIVYSDGSEADLRAYVRKLETFDRVLRLNMGLPVDQVPPRKLPIYSVRNRVALETVWPETPDQTAGYYVAEEQDIFAVALRERGSDDILLHEYGHHFMYQNFAYGYPGWFSEGFAEYFATADIDGGTVDVGRASENRAYWLLNGRWIALETLMAKRPGEIGGREETYYPQAWLLAHWFLSDAQRQQTLEAYLRDVGNGGDPVEAMQRATGMDMEALTRTLRAYTRQRIPYRRITSAFPEIPVSVTTLGPSADALLLINQRLKRDVAEEDRPTVIADVRRAAARWPDDVFARVVLARAELVAGDPAQGEQVLADVLQSEPANVEALQLMARAIMMRADAETDFEAGNALQQRARSFLGRAFAADDANFTTFLMIAESRRTSPTYPNQNDIATLRLAVVLAPQLPGARLNLAAALIDTGADPAETISLLAPVANDPHDTDLASAAQTLIDRASRGDASGVLAGTSGGSGDPSTAEPEDTRAGDDPDEIASAPAGP